MFSAQDVKALRERTGAGMMDCKKALQETNGNMDDAITWLREKGISKAAKKAERIAAEGLTESYIEDSKAVVVEVNCETDFVAKNENFQALFDSIMEKVAASDKEINTWEDMEPALAETIDNEVKEFVGKTGENMKVGAVLVTTQKAFIYNHPGNKVSTLIFSEGSNDEVAKELALQVTAMNPTFVSFDQVDQNEIAKLTEEFGAELRAAGKPEAMIAQIVDGKIKKALADNVLLEQEYIRDAGKKVKDILPEGMKIIKFVRMAIGS